MPIDFELFRRVVGSFPSGVTIVTVLDEDGTPKGLTSNAICSVSADPPLLLVCVDKRSQTLPALKAARAFAVNFLLAGREELSNRFASKDSNKFDRVAWEPSQVANGAPILVDDILACAECITTQEIEAGDHWVFIGRIEAGKARDGTPMMYYRRSYASWPQAQPLRAS